MSYATTEDVAAYTPGLLDSGHDDYTTTTRPTKAQVVKFLNAGYSLINARLSAEGYTPPVTSSADVYELVQDLEALYGAGRAEMVRMTSRIAATERTRSQMFMDQFNAGLDMLTDVALTGAGLSKTSGMYAGGISVSDKRSRENDTDRVKPRMTRGMFRATGTQRPGGGASDDESG